MAAKKQQHLLGHLKMCVFRQMAPQLHLVLRVTIPEHIPQWKLKEMLPFLPVRHGIQCLTPAAEAIGIEMTLNGNMTVDGTLKVVSANSTGSELLLKENAVLTVNGTITTAAKGKVTGTDATSVVSIAEGATGTDTFAAGSTYNWNGSVWEKQLRKMNL